MASILEFAGVHYFTKVCVCPCGCVCLCVQLCVCLCVYSFVSCVSVCVCMTSILEFASVEFYTKVCACICLCLPQVPHAHVIFNALLANSLDWKRWAFWKWRLRAGWWWWEGGGRWGRGGGLGGRRGLGAKFRKSTQVWNWTYMNNEQTHSGSHTIRFTHRSEKIDMFFLKKSPTGWSLH